MGSLSPRFYGVPFDYSHRRTAEQDAPTVLELLRADRVDVAMAAPHCPVCHQSVALVARHLEANGVPTVVVASARDIIEEIGVARFLFVDVPLGYPIGRPGDADQQRRTCSQALDLLDGCLGGGTTRSRRTPSGATTPGGPTTCGWTTPPGRRWPRPVTAAVTTSAGPWTTPAPGSPDPPRRRRSRAPPPPRRHAW